MRLNAARNCRLFAALPLLRKSPEQPNSFLPLQWERLRWSSDRTLDLKNALLCVNNTSSEFDGTLCFHCLFKGNQHVKKQRQVHLVLPHFWYCA